MDLDASYILCAIIVGLGATLVMDLWNLFLKRAFGIPSLNYCLLGRWLLHMPEGTFRHASIAAAPRKPFECMAGLIAHYTIGVVLALGLVALASGDWLARPTLLPALLYGIVTVVFPFFIMQPAFGLGIAASKTPNPTQARLKSLMTHTVFGVGLYLCLLGVSHALMWYVDVLPVSSHEPTPSVRLASTRHADVKAALLDKRLSAARTRDVQAAQLSGDLRRQLAPVTFSKVENGAP